MFNNKLHCFLLASQKKMNLPMTREQLKTSASWVFVPRTTEAFETVALPRTPSKGNGRTRLVTRVVVLYRPPKIKNKKRRGGDDNDVET